MADNVLIDEGTGGTTGVPVAADEIAGVKHQRVKVEHGADGSATDVSTASPMPVRLGDGTTQSVVKPASTPALAADPAVVVAVSPNNMNANGSNSRANSTPVVSAYEEYEVVEASASDQVLGAAGAVGDILAHLLVIPLNLTSSAISIKDGNGSAIQVFAGGTLGSLIPFVIPLNIRASAVTSPGWKVTTGTNVRVIAFGDFT